MLSKYYSAQGALRGAKICLLMIVTWSAWAIGYIGGHSPTEVNTKRSHYIEFTPQKTDSINSVYTI